ncbi:MAG TPA: FHA domain-containing protein, partial [Planctomycetaceae bacterium]|nr:FHA domain-containing protein [Planctomycetaceae bacterium]
MPTLVLLQGGEARRFDLTQPETVLGRHPECAVCLDSNMVSRRHARVLHESAGYFIEDLGSGNGTTVNGQRIFGKTPVRHEDRIKIGPILLRFEDPAQAAAAKRKAPSETLPFNLDLSSGPEDGSTIMGAISSSGQFGALEVRPEAKLKAVLEINRTLAGTLDLQKILPKILDTLFNVFPQADRGCVLLRDDHSGLMVPRAIKHRRTTDDDSVKLSRTILKKVLEEKTAILSADAANDARFNAAESISNFTIRSMMCVPLLGLDGEPMGVINVDTQNPLKQFTKDDLELLTAVAGQAALSYENARLLVS